MIGRSALLCGLLLLIALLGAAPSAGAQPSPLRLASLPSTALTMRPTPAGTLLIVNDYVHRSTTTDPWWAQDKLQHVTFSLLWTLSAQYVLVEKVNWSRSEALPVSAGSAAAVGLSKEFFDWRIGSSGQFSRRDLVADAVGILLAVGIIVL